MNSSNLMAGVLVVGAVVPTTEMPHHCHYNTAANPVRNNKKSIPIRIHVNKRVKQLGFDTSESSSQT